MQVLDTDDAKSYMILYSCQESAEYYNKEDEIDIDHFSAVDYVRNKKRLDDNPEAHWKFEMQSRI